MHGQPDVTMPFGKFKGERLRMLRESYLTWLLDNCEKLGRWLRSAIEEELEERKIRFLLDGDIELGLCVSERKAFWDHRFPINVYEDKFEVVEALIASKLSFNFVIHARRVSVRGFGRFDNYLNLWPECSDLIVIANSHELFFTDSGLPFT